MLGKTMLLRTSVAASMALLAIAPATARAELPDPIRAMIDAAIETGDEAKVRTVLELARQTNPDDAGEIDAILTRYETDLAAKAETAAEAEKLQIRNAGIFDNWSGKGELGAFRATGNSSNAGATASISLNREGINWTHKIRGRADYQRNNGVTSREQYSLSYEPNISVSDRLFLYGLTQYERDRFQGFSGRYSFSGGVGYTILDRPDLNLSAKVGPAYRITEFVAGGSEARFAGLVGVDFDWDITDRLTLTQDTNAVAETGGSATLIVDANNTSLNLVTGLNAKISDSLTTRFSYAVEYDSNPPDGAVGTDTLSRVTLIYGF